MGLLTEGGGGYAAVVGELEKVPRKFRKEFTEAAKKMQSGDSIYDLISEKTKTKIQEDPGKLFEIMRDIDAKFEGSGRQLVMDYEGYQRFLANQLSGAEEDDGNDTGVEASSASEVIARRPTAIPTRRRVARTPGVPRTARRTGPRTVAQTSAPLPTVAEILPTDTSHTYDLSIDSTTTSSHGRGRE
jgi:hypothetical protein